MDLAGINALYIVSSFKVLPLIRAGASCSPGYTRAVAEEYKRCAEPDRHRSGRMGKGLGPRLHYPCFHQLFRFLSQNRVLVVLVVRCFVSRPVLTLPNPHCDIVRL